MPRTAVPKTATPNYVGVLAGAALTPVAADTVNFNQAVLTGNEILIAMNVGAAIHNVTVTSAADVHGRVQHITTDPVPAAAGAPAVPGMKIYPRFPVAGWQQTDLNLYFQGDHADLKFFVIQL